MCIGCGTGADMWTEPRNFLRAVAAMTAASAAMTPRSLPRYPEDGTDLDTAVMHANRAMYGGKRAGRNTYRFCVDESRQRAGWEAVPVRKLGSVDPAVLDRFGNVR